MMRHPEGTRAKKRAGSDESSKSYLYQMRDEG